ncbi:hypothetical protein B0H13DRAFT_2272705 [Mycena leptocephala]|nr:hypothetical protein B0H13DRAFT_2272705 [Mycena leptocephala]
MPPTGNSPVVCNANACSSARLGQGNEERAVSRNRRQEGGIGRARNKGDEKERKEKERKFSVGLRMVRVGNVDCVGVVSRSVNRECWTSHAPPDGFGELDGSAGEWAMSERYRSRIRVATNATEHRAIQTRVGYEGYMVTDRSDSPRLKRGWDDEEHWWHRLRVDGRRKRERWQRDFDRMVGNETVTADLDFASVPIRPWPSSLLTTWWLRLAKGGRPCIFPHTLYLFYGRQCALLDLTWWPPASFIRVNDTSDVFKLYQLAILYSVVKYMGDLKGQPIFNAAYTIMNEFEEVRAHSLTQTKSLGFVQDVFEGIQEGLKNANHPPTQLFYTDSPQLERSFHESINSSLTKDVEPITEWTNLPAFPRNSEIIAAFLTDSMEIEEAASDILSDIIAPPQFSPVALAIKTGQDANKQPHLEIIQLRTRDKIIVFQVSALTSRSEILPSLRAILTNPAIVKIGHATRKGQKCAHTGPGKICKAKSSG